MLFIFIFGMVFFCWAPNASGGKVIAVPMAPIEGHGDRIWITSFVADGPHVDIRDWGKPQAFSGVLATFDQAIMSFPMDLSAQARRTLPHLPATFVVVPDTPWLNSRIQLS